MGDSSSTAQRVPVKSGLYTHDADSGGSARLLASHCPACGEIFFPRRRLCQNCQDENLQTMELGTRGRIFSFTVVMQRPPFDYEGPVPYAFGWVELPDGVRVETLFTGCPPDELRVGMDVELVIEPLHLDSQGREIVCHKFRPVRDAA